MFIKSAAFYDLVYGFKDYAAEADHVRRVIDSAKKTNGRRLLDVACGTGQHLQHLAEPFACEGLDLDPQLLKIARRRLPDVQFTHADMVDFDLGRRFDAVVCLFSSIGYVATLDKLRMTARTFTRHLVPGGVVVVEPWLTPDVFRPGHVQALLAEGSDLKVARMSSSDLQADRWVLNFHYLVGRPAGVEYFTEQHHLGRFTTQDYVNAFTDAGVQVSYDPEGISGRGLVIGAKPAT
ncbi:MAG TPA: class I SAM-dependent methyltransferase [Chloroflexota bacterium]|jgi:ubiquinone/menaquinone biosynthesis C-methylase UbiE